MGAKRLLLISIAVIIFFEEFQNFFYYVLFGLADGIDGGEVYVFLKVGLTFEVFVHQLGDVMLHTLKEQKGAVVTAELTAVHSFPGSDGLAYHKFGDTEVATGFAEAVGQLHYTAADYLEDIEHEVGNEDAGYVFVAGCEPFVDDIVSYIKYISSAWNSSAIIFLAWLSEPEGTVILSLTVSGRTPLRCRRAEVIRIVSILL